MNFLPVPIQMEPDGTYRFWVTLTLEATRQMEQWERSDEVKPLNLPRRLGAGRYEIYSQPYECDRTVGTYTFRGSDGEVLMTFNIDTVEQISRD